VVRVFAALGPNEMVAQRQIADSDVEPRTSGLVALVSDQISEFKVGRARIAINDGLSRGGRGDLDDISSRER
jgi:hypothetical protein